MIPTASAIRLVLPITAAIMLHLTAPQVAHAADESLSDLLALLPEGEATYSSMPLFAYTDFRAMEKAAAVRHPTSEAEFKGWREVDRNAWLRAMLRIKGGPDGLISYVPGTRLPAMAEVMGFDFFDVDRAIDLWDLLPHSLTILSGSTNLTRPDEIRDALTRRGYSLTTVDNMPVWSRFADGTIGAGGTDEGAVADPFSGAYMRPARIALESGLLIGTSNTADLRTVLALQHGHGTPDRLVALLNPIFDAIAPIGGPVIQAWAVPVTATGVVPEGPLAEAFSQQKELLPLYPIAVFADLQSGTQQMVVIALPYADRASAELASRLVAARLANWETALIATHDNWVKKLGGTVASRVVEVANYGAAVRASFDAQFKAHTATQADGLELAKAAVGAAKDGAIALITVRAPMTQSDGSIDSAKSTPSGGLWAVFQDAINYRDFAPLMIR